MGFVERELQKIRTELAKHPNGPKATELRAANQALAWSLEPQGIAAPYAVVMGIREEQEDCSDECRPPLS